MPTKNRPFTNVYDKEYFSGIQAGLYIGDVYVDEVTAVAYSRSHNKTPIYGYMSELYDAVANGQVLIHGQLAINFKESAYLYLILMRYKQFFDRVDEVLGQSGLEGFKEASKVDKSMIPQPFRKEGRGKEIDGISRIDIQRLLQGEFAPEERFEFYNSLAGFASEVGRDLTFENLAEVFEDQVWSKRDEELDKEVRNADNQFFNGFDMYITFGDYNNRGANHTVVKISDVHIIGESQEIVINGEPIQETYNFFARTSF